MLSRILVSLFLFALSGCVVPAPPPPPSPMGMVSVPNADHIYEPPAGGGFDPVADCGRSYVAQLQTTQNAYGANWLEVKNYSLSCQKSPQHY